MLVIDLFKIGKFFYVVIIILVVVCFIVVMMLVWIGVIGILFVNGIGIGIGREIGIGMVGIGVGFWGGLEDWRREKEIVLSSLIICLYFEGLV